MKNAQNTSIRLLALLLLALPLGCKEFYDEQFDELQLSSQVEGEQQDVSYQADLNPTDPNVSEITGTSRVNVQGDAVSVSVQLQGIPDNLVQLHYGYIAAACSAITVAIPAGGTGTKTFNLTENSTLNSLRQDLATSGASTASGDTDLSNKSFVVKAFSSVSTATTGTTGTAVIVACGDLNISNDPESDDDTTTTPTQTDTGILGQTTDIPTDDFPSDGLPTDTDIGSNTGTDIGSGTTTGTTGTFDPLPTEFSF